MSGSLPPIRGASGRTPVASPASSGSQRQKRDGRSVHIEERPSEDRGSLSAHVLLGGDAAADRRVEWIVQQLHGALLAGGVSDARRASQRDSLRF